MTIRIKTQDQFRCALVGVLHDIKQGRISVQDEGGVCAIVRCNMIGRYGWAAFDDHSMSDLVTTALWDGFEAWPEYSGRRCYPVPAPACFEYLCDKPGRRAEEAYSLAWNEQYTTITHWGDDEYGQSRWRLLDFLIEYHSS